jgi:hypothetical protein
MPRLFSRHFFVGASRTASLGETGRSVSSARNYPTPFRIRNLKTRHGDKRNPALRLTTASQGDERLKGAWLFEFRCFNLSKRPALCHVRELRNLFGFALSCVALPCGVGVRLHLVLFPAGGPFLPSLCTSIHPSVRRRSKICKLSPCRVAAAAPRRAID